MARKGDKVVVVKGVKIPKGTTGVVFWVGDTKFGARVGFKPDGGGDALFTAAGNVEPVSDAVVGAVKATAAVAADDKFAALEARVVALEAALGLAAAPAPAVVLSFPVAA